MRASQRALLILVASVAATALVVAGGCNTVKGLGKDLENLGRNTQDAAERAAD